MARGVRVRVKVKEEGCGSEFLHLEVGFFGGDLGVRRETGALVLIDGIDTK